jgi:hypothetical protein
MATDFFHLLNLNPMAKWFRGINSPIVGKLGDVVGSTWRGIPYAKTPPVRRKQGSSPAQQKQQTTFGMTNALLKYFKNVVKITFVTSDTRKTGMNNATKYNQKIAIAGEFPDLYVDFTKLTVAKGDLPPAEECAVTVNGTTLTFTWKPNLGTGSAQERDQVVLVAYCPERKKCEELFGTANRATGRAVLPVPLFKGEEVHTYIAFTTEDRKQSSDSVYAGSVIVPAG